MVHFLDVKETIALTLVKKDNCRLPSDTSKEVETTIATTRVSNEPVAGFF